MGKILATNSNVLIPRTYMVERENLHLQLVLWPRNLHVINIKKKKKLHFG